MEKEKISLEEIKNEGLLFLRSNNLLGLFTCVITGQPFDIAGIYYTENIMGVNNIRYIFIDLKNGLSISTVNDYGPILKDLVDSKEFYEIGIAELKDVYENGVLDVEKTKDRRDEFRAHIVNILNSTPKCLEEYIKRLFGRKIYKDSNKYNSIDIVNIISNLILGENIKPNWDINENEEIRIVNSEKKIYSIIANIFAQNIVENSDEYNTPIQTYLKNNLLFDNYKLVERQISKKELDDHFEEKVLTDGSLKNIFNEIEKEIRNDKEFYNAIINGMQLRIDRKYLATDLYKNLIIKNNEILEELSKKIDINDEENKKLKKQLEINKLYIHK